MSVIDQTSGVTYATLSLAISNSAAGDVIQVSAGSYVENFPKITHSLTIESIGGLASLSNPQAQPPNGSAVLDVALDAGANLTVSGLEIFGAANDPASNNGAGIRFESGNGVLRVTNSFIHDNQDGILTGGVDAASPGGVMSVFIDHSEISNNGVDSSNPAYGFDHNIYAGTLTEIDVTNSYLHDALGGHEVKSRAATTVITGNRIQDGPTSPTSYDIDLPDGGADTVSGNTIEKGANAQNRSMIHFGGEGTYANSSLSVSGNVFINDRQSGATAVLNQTNLAGANVAAVISGNTLYNVGAANLSSDAIGTPADITSNNTYPTGAAPALNTSAGYVVACFAEGTLIRTERGDVSVQALAVGDRAVLAGGGSRPIVWIGWQRAHPSKAEAPVRIVKDAFGPARPQRDLVLSPEHAVYANGVLLPVETLVDDRLIRRFPMATITYWHVELDRHDVILAEGLPVESYLENGNRDGFETLAPGGVEPEASPWPCAPILRQGPILEEVRTALRQRARQPTLA